MNRFPFSPDTIRLLADILVEKGLIEIELAEKDSRNPHRSGGAERRAAGWGFRFAVACGAIVLPAETRACAGQPGRGAATGGGIVADGRHRLSQPGARCAALRDRRPACRSRTYAAAHRSNENVQSSQGADQWRGEAGPDRSGQIAEYGQPLMVVE